MKISLASVSVGNQEAALTFYTQTLGFVKKKDNLLGDARRLTVVSPEDMDGPELTLEPNAEYPPIKALRKSLVKNGMLFTAFEVDDLDADYRRLRQRGVEFAKVPVDSPGEKYAILDDTCGNLIRIYEVTG